MRNSVDVSLSSIFCLLIIERDDVCIVKVRYSGYGLNGGMPMIVPDHSKGVLTVLVARIFCLPSVLLFQTLTV